MAGFCRKRSMTPLEVSYALAQKSWEIMKENTGNQASHQKSQYVANSLKHV